VTKFLKRTAFFLILFQVGFTQKILWAQIELSNFNATGRAGISTTLATDYQAQGINPANLALVPQFEGFHHTFGMGELGFSG
jgi:hypothetical protein